MRRVSVGAFLVLWASGCGGNSDDPTPIVEVCDNGTDDDGDGSTDCEDSDCGAATACNDTGSATTTPTLPTTTTAPTGVTNPSSLLGLVVDPSYSFQNEAGLTACPQKIGRVVAQNPTAEDAHLVLSADAPLNMDGVIEFDGVGLGATTRFIDQTVAAQTDTIIDVYYTCNAPASFTTWFHVTFDSASESNAADLFLSGVLK